MSEPKRQHFVPRFLLRRFAKDGRFVRIYRASGKANTKASPRSACTIEDFYTIEDPAEPEPLRVEKKLAAEIETPAALAIEAIVSGEFPPSDEHRAALIAFVSAQFVRGPDTRNFLNHVMRALVMNRARKMGRARALADLRQKGFPINADGTLTKDAMIHMQESAFDLDFASMRIALIVFEDPALITSDRPVVQWGNIGPDTPSFGVGIDVPHSVCLHLDPRHALLFVPGDVHVGRWEERRVDGDALHARRLNERAAAWAFERVFHDPDHDPLAGIDLTSMKSFDVELRDALSDPGRTKGARRSSSRSQRRKKKARRRK